MEPAVFSGWNFLISWFAHLFNPPLLNSLSQWQRIVRSFLVALSLFVLCIAVATLGATFLYVAGHARALVNDQTTVAGLGIVLVAVIGDTLCFRALLAIKRGV